MWLFAPWIAVGMTSTEEDRDLAMTSHSSFEMPDLDKKRDTGLGDVDIEASRVQIQGRA